MWTILEELKTHLSHDLCLDAITIYWKTWETRNKIIHGSLEDLPRDIIGWARHFRTAFTEAQIADTMEYDVRFDEQWYPPDPGKIKINVDVALPVDQDFIQLGLVARNSEGQVVWWRSKKITGRPTPTDGEALAVYHGVLLARDKAWPQVIIETDCLSIFRSLSSSSSSRNLLSYGALIDTCFANRVFFNVLSFSFVRRSGNVLAHTLATSLALSNSEGPSLPDLIG